MLSFQRSPILLKKRLPDNYGVKMGQILNKIFKVVENKKGLEGRMELAKTTKISRKEAESVSDTADLIEKVKRAADEIVGEDIDNFL